MRDFSRLDGFLDQINQFIYSEPPSEPHVTITRQVVAQLKELGWVYPDARILDVGCGQGTALEEFRTAGADALGTAMYDEDIEVCRRSGFEVLKIDQNFMIPPIDETFDLIFSRHVLEHSFAPYFTLSEYWCLTEPGKHLYIEVPAPDTERNHQCNINHYSVLPLSAWRSLILRARFTIEKMQLIKSPGPPRDEYYAFFLTRS